LGQLRRLKWQQRAFGLRSGLGREHAMLSCLQGFCDRPFQQKILLPLREGLLLRYVVCGLQLASKSGEAVAVQAGLIVRHGVSHESFRTRRHGTAEFLLDRDQAGWREVGLSRRGAP
jgi:hypothetical protein